MPEPTVVRGADAPGATQQVNVAAEMHVASGREFLARGGADFIRKAETLTNADGATQSAAAAQGEDKAPAAGKEQLVLAAATASPSLTEATASVKETAEVAGPVAADPASSPKESEQANGQALALKSGVVAPADATAGDIAPQPFVEKAANTAAAKPLTGDADTQAGATLNAAPVAAALVQQAPPPPAPAAPAGPSFDLVKDFSAAENPGHAWSYGWLPAAGGSFALMTGNDNHWNLEPGFSTWYVPAGNGSLPGMAKNGTGVTKTYLGSIVQPADLIDLYPSPGGDKAVVRWTAPAPMTVQVEGRFEGLDTVGTTSDVTITHNSAAANAATTLAKGSVTGYGARVPFSFIRKVATGDVLDFVVGYGSNLTNSNDGTGLAVKITPAAVKVFDAVKDFSKDANPGSTWSYGYAPAAGGPFALMTGNDNHWNLEPGFSTWYVPTGSGGLPGMAKNGTGVTKTYLTSIVHPADLLDLYPSPNGDKSIVRWTAPSAMTVQIEGRFEGMDTNGPTTDVSITQNSTTTLLAGNVTGYTSRVPFMLVRKVAAGDVIDFAVGYGSNLTNASDSTGLGVTISQTFNAVDDFSPTSNVSGAWSYGYRAPSSTKFELMTNNADVWAVGPDILSWTAPNGGANLPGMGKNVTGATKTYLGSIVQPADVLNLYPSPGGDKAVVRWTAPAAMTVQIDGRFEGIDTNGATSDVSIVQNSTTLLSGNVAGYGTRVPFSLLKKVAAGDVIDFMVGYGANLTNGADSTGLAVSITVPPLAAYWQFNEDAGAVAVDATGHGNTGTLQTPTRVVGRDGSGALNFAGADAVSVAANGTLTNVYNDFTVSFWVNPRAAHEIDPESTTIISGTAGQKYVIGARWSDGNSAGAGVSVGTNGVSVYEHAAGYMPAPLVYQGAITGWNHVTLVYENRQPKLYLNGALVKTGLVSPKTFVNIVPQAIGGHSYGYFDGQLDDVRVYSRAMSADEVQALSSVPVVNAAPAVSVTAPASGAVLNAPVNINITANATDDGSVSKVQFYANGNLVGTKTEQPYTVTWGNAAAGTYAITARATDDAGVSTTSAPVNITVAAQPGTRVQPPAGSRLVTADVVALDQVIVYNRLGAINPAGMMFALRRDVVPVDPAKGIVPGNVQLRPDKRPRPLVLRMNVGDRLQINFQNLLSPSPADDNQPATRTAGVHVVGLQLVNNI
ncbi:MAG TPA: LamG-like jellyroll fold domain-containing protein, partial [Pyrinomonadaceae bacterium]